MFENMVKSAALPMVLELLHATKEALDVEVDNLLSEEDGEGFDHALKVSEVNGLCSLSRIVETLIQGLDQSHQEVHGTPAPHPVSTPRTNFGPHP